MGNCVPKSAAPRHQNSLQQPSVLLYGPAASTATSWIRLALLYKTIPLQFHPSPADAPVLRCGPDTVTGSLDAIMRYIDTKLPGPAVRVDVGEGSSAVAMLAALQHRSLLRQLERMAAWAEEVAERGGGGDALAWRGSPRMEMRRFGRSYGQVAELLLEHARMEEMVVFPVLERADRGLSKSANEEHARDLPIINGIKEDIKSIIVLDAGNNAYQEALLNLSLRVRKLLEHCREHFAEEERDLLPLLEVAERSSAEEMGLDALEQVVTGVVMEGTHSHLFHVLMAGFQPQEAMKYLELVCRCRNQDRVVKMLSALAVKMEAAAAMGITPPLRCSSRSSHAMALASG